MVTNSAGDTVYQFGTAIQSGSKTFQIPKVDLNVPGKYRDIYTVTLKAKNGSDATWSNDSYLLHVYSDEALKIWVRSADGTTEVLSDAASYTLSNIDTIGQMDQTAILALNRDIFLRKVISANYGEYAYAQITDQLAWKSSASRVASINNQHMSVYENIEGFSYPTYLPATDFVLSGLVDGETTITASHTLTKDVAKLVVDVKTLKDKRKVESRATCSAVRSPIRMRSIWAPSTRIRCSPPSGTPPSCSFILSIT